MKSPPGAPQPTRNGITGTRTKAEAKRAVTAKIIRAMKAAGLAPTGWQVRRLAAELMLEREEPTEEQVARALMSAPWFPKQRRRRYRLGETGWRVSSASGAVFQEER